MGLLHDSNIHLFRKAILIRTVEEALLELFKQGKLNGTIHTCVGQEFTGVAISEFLRADDFVISNHRGHGHYLARTGDVTGLIGEVMGKINGAVGGIGGSQHLCNKNYMSNGIQGGMAPVAGGIALSFKLKKQNNISVVFIGDGTLGEGTLYEAMNLCGVWQCPIVFVMENNHYAQSTSSKQTFSGNLKSRIEGFGLTFYRTNTWELDHLMHTCKSAINLAREKITPVFIEIETYRLNAHSKGDDNRSEQEVAHYRKKDLINRLKIEHVQAYKELESEARSVVKNAIHACESCENLSYFPNHDFVYTAPYELNTLMPSEKSAERINDLIYQSIRENFEKYPLSIMIGEDIEAHNQFTPKMYGGAFKVSKDLSILFPDRVRNTPISEAAITGFATGLAIGGFKSVVEIMFGDFTTLIVDQVYQHACKFNRMYNGKINVPLIIRTPMGGKRGYGPTHSQSIEKLFLGVPDLTMIALNHRVSPKTIYQRIFDSMEHPYMVVENKILYTRYFNYNSIVGFEILLSDEPFPTVIIRPCDKSPDITVFCYGGMLEEVETAVEKAFDEDDILCEIIAPTQLCPINLKPLLDSVKTTAKVLFVEEGCNFGSLSAELCAKMLEYEVNVKKTVRLSNNNIIPSSYEAEINLIPGVNTIYQAIKKLYVG